MQPIFRVVMTWLILASIGIVHTSDGWSAQIFGTSASERTLAQTVIIIKAKREPILAQSQSLVTAAQTAEAMGVLEGYLTAYPEDIVAANFYRAVAVRANAYDRPIQFFVARVKELTPCPKDPPPDPPDCPGSQESCTTPAAKLCSPTALPPGPPAGLRYNLAFAYIDKIPVVGPMGAGFLSKRSIVQFQLALDQDPNDWIANYGVGMNYLHWPDYFGKNDASIAYFEHAIAIQEARPIRPSDILAYVRLGDALAKAGKLDLAQATWKRGVARVGQHPDLSERLNIPTAQLHQAVVDAYNPNNSIGAIDTDISILWSEIMPTKVLSLRGNNNQIVVGSMGKPAQPNAEANSATKFFSWFRDNLPLLIRRDQANQVNMQGIGATNQAGVGIIAHNMVKGFMTQFRGDASAQVIDMLNQAPSYERPFFHEGIGMGLGAALDTSASGSLAPFARQIAVFDPNFERLHYAGLGMWFGLAPTVNLVRIRTKLNELSARGQFYAHEGLGFAVVLFNTNLDPAVQLVQRLPFALAATFAHGAGRALWIKYGNDAASVSHALDKFPDRMQSDVQAGFGMGVAFTRVDQLDVILAQTIPLRQLSATACGNYLTGTAMGLSIRYQADPVYMRTMLKSKASPQSQQLARISLQAGMDALQDITQIGVEMHQNWRAAIRTQFSTGQAATLVKDICETPTP